MKAIVVRQFGSPEALQIEEAPTPIPQRGQILVGVRAAGVNPLETYLRAGAKIGGHQAHLPYTPGSEAAGIVTELSPDVEGFVPGDRVYGPAIGGSYAEYTLMQADFARKLPESLSFAQGSAITGPYRAAHLSLHHLGEVKSGERLLIHGASGSVGRAALQLASGLGVTLFATAGSESEEKSLQIEGADHVWNHHEPERRQQAMQASGGNPFHLILEMNAAKNLASDLRSLAPGGRVVIIGGQGKTEIDPVDIIAGGLRLLGLSIPDTPEAVLQQVYDDIYAGLMSGTLKPPAPKEVSLLQARRAHEEMSQPKVRSRFALIPERNL